MGGALHVLTLRRWQLWGWHLLFHPVGWHRSQFLAQAVGCKYRETVKYSKIKAILLRQAVMRNEEHTLQGKQNNRRHQDFFRFLTVSVEDGAVWMEVEGASSFLCSLATFLLLKSFFHQDFFLGFSFWASVEVETVVATVWVLVTSLCRFASSS